MKRCYTLESHQPPAKLIVSPAQRDIPLPPNMEGLNESELKRYDDNLFEQLEIKICDEKELVEQAAYRTPREREQLKEYILNASDEKMKNSHFDVNQLFTMIHSGTQLAVKKILNFHPELVNQHGKSGKTALMTALRQTKHNSTFSPGMVKILLSYKANPFLRDILPDERGEPLTPMEFIMQNPARTKKNVEKQCKKCEALFKAYEKNIESQPLQENIFDLHQTFNSQVMPSSQDLSELEVPQLDGFANVLRELELILPVLDSLEQDQICDKKLEPEELNHRPTERWMEYLEDLLFQPEIILPEFASLEQSQVCEKNVERDLLTTSSSLQLSGNKTTENKNELTASTDFFQTTKGKRR